MSFAESIAAERPQTYALNRKNSDKAIALGLAEADWYQCPVPREEMKKLLVRKNGPAIRDTILWFGIILFFAISTYLLWGTWWAILPYLCYAALYASTSDSRWHESLHGTAFATDWMNVALYEVASFMVLRESTVWRWSHTRHHSDTIILGRDPEIAVPRPPDLAGLGLAVFSITAYRGYFTQILNHSFGKVSEHEAQFIPKSEFPKLFFKARIYLAIYSGVIALSIATASILPLMFVGLPHLFGTWLMLVYGLTQHTGMAENVLDHRLNCRTFHTNIVNRFLYWNMNYHIEHHMFPLVPYHALPRLHELVKDDCPPPYPSLLSCWREIIPTVIRQLDEPCHHVQPILPKSAKKESPAEIRTNEESGGWVRVCEASDLENESVIRFDHEDRTFALYRDDEGSLYATAGICTHGRTHLAEGLVIGKLIECPKHNGRFNIPDGSPARKPVCKALETHPVEDRNGILWIKLPASPESKS